MKKSKHKFEVASWGQRVFSTVTHLRKSIKISGASTPQKMQAAHTLPPNHARAEFMGRRRRAGF